MILVEANRRTYLLEMNVIRSKKGKTALSLRWKNEKEK